jgi:hypothetical protein
MEERRIESILAIDIGSVLTKATLVARVEGVYRFVGRGEAPSTVEPPWLDTIAGVDHALEQLIAVTHRPVLDEHGRLITPERPDGNGVDACVFTASAAGPLKLVLIGLSADLSVSSLQRAAASTYTQVTEVLTRAGELDGQSGLPPLRGGGKRLTEEDRVRRIYRARPEVVCVVGGTDGGASTPCRNGESVAMASTLLGEAQRPRILFAGNASLRPQVAEIIGAEAELLVSDNVRPSVDVENLGPAQAELEAMYQAIKIAQLPGFGDLKTWSTQPVLPTARAIAHVVQYLSLEDTHKGTLGVDVGASSTTIAAAKAGQVQVHVRSDLGTALSARNVLQTRGMDAITRWLPFEPNPGEIESLITRKSCTPPVPQDGRSC